MVNSNACGCISKSLPTHVPYERCVLPRKRFSRPANLLRFNKSALRGLSVRATAPEDGTNQYFGGERGTISAVEAEAEAEEKPAAGHNSFAEKFSSAAVSNDEPSALSSELLENIDLKFDSENTLSIALYGSGALVVIWFASAVIGAIDSIPLAPYLLEVVGLGYTAWFTWRYLIFKDNRAELFAKISELKQQALGSKHDD